MANTNELDVLFKYHPPKEGQAKRYEIIRSDARNFAELLLAWCPESRERAIAIQKIEEAVMWANSAIARNA